MLRNDDYTSENLLDYLCKILIKSLVYIYRGKQT